MNKAILGTKLGMTQIFTEDGLAIPVTVIEAGPCVVIQKKTVESDGYNAIKVGFREIREKLVNKPDMGQFKKANTTQKRYVNEFRFDDVSGYEVGQEIKTEDMFTAGDQVDISGISRGKGFQGTIKKYHQHGGPETHGSMYHRRVGSNGANTHPARVFKGKKLPGHMGNESVTIQNLNVVRVDIDKKVILIKGAVPGPKGGLLMIKNTVKKA